MITSVVLSAKPDSFVYSTRIDGDNYLTDMYRCSYDILFKPPEPVAGKHCVMTVKNAALEFSTIAADTEELFWTYLVSLNLRQPSSFCSVNDDYPVSSDGGDGLTMLRGSNQVVAVVQPFKGFSNNSQFVVDIPNGPQLLTVTVQRANARYMSQSSSTESYQDPTEYSVTLRFVLS